MIDANFKTKLFLAAARLGFQNWELYYMQAKNFSVKVLNGEINEYKNSDTLGLCFRGMYRGRMGYAFTERPDENMIEPMLTQAIKNAKIIESEDIVNLYKGDSIYPKIHSYNPAINEISVSEKIQLALDMERAAYETDSRVKLVNYCAVSNGESEIYITNSFRLDQQYKSNHILAYLQAIVEENEITKTGFKEWHGRDISDFSPQSLAREAVNEALAMLPAKSLDSGNLPVVFDKYMACDLFSVFARAFFAETAQKGFSLLRNKTGQQIAADIVTIHDDGIHPDSLGSVPFDSEGVSCRNKVVVENGVLKTLLYNLKSAEKENKHSTGNGFKSSFRSPVDTACTNFYVLPSDISFDSLLSKVDQGLLVTDLAGLHSGANPITGDFSLSASGFEIKNGKKLRPVEQVTVSGNFFELLKNIAAIGDDLRFDLPSSTGTIGMPSILVRDLSVAGG
ncbi:MAG: TldD/PmbA family protein [Clostridiales bacterium]|jgi:PmbA protein|nr:TldD/PmbA family protein [Clostridiales bacterium]